MVYYLLIKLKPGAKSKITNHKSKIINHKSQICPVSYSLIDCKTVYTSIQALLKGGLRQACYL